MADKLEKVKVTAVELLDHDCIQVTGQGPSRSHRLFTVHFTRKGEIRNGFLHEPEYAQGYLAVDQIPVAVVTAAVELYKKEQYR